MKIFKVLFVIGVFAFLRWMLLIVAISLRNDHALSINLISGIISLIGFAMFVICTILLSAYYFPIIEVDDEGLIVEFLWKWIRIRWEDVVEMKPRYGLLYGFSLKPAFVIQPSIFDFELLNKDIEKHIKQNHHAKK